MRPYRYAILSGLIATIAFVVTSVNADQASKESNVSQTLHNFSATGTGAVRTTDPNTEVCVFCHTPHGATTFPGAPLWNRSVNDTYTPYTSSSLDAETIMGGSLDSPAGSSKLCLSCHDGTLALGTVNVFAGQTNYTFPMTSTTMPDGEGSATGFTRNLGTDLSNDHPISLTYNSDVATQDGELFTPAVGSGVHIDTRSPGNKPLIPLEPTGTAGAGQIQCATCHDPHIFDPAAVTSIKFLRLNRFQQGPAAEGSFTEFNDMVCLGCHDKKGWSTSAHADNTVANETYISTAPNLREIPAGMPVWQVGCLNCHDTHTVHGARRLLREGTDSLSDPKSGGNSAIEETCYQCHSSNPIITNVGNDVPDIETDFKTLNRHMPISNIDQPAATEVHDITDADFSETREKLGRNNDVNRHVECTDCHNPHRVMKDRLFNGISGDTSEGTHEHASGHTNIASGVLRGTWGVEPVYGGNLFLEMPLNYVVKNGDGGLGAPAGANGNAANYVTREYQVCLKCHSDYGYTDTGTYPSGGRPIPGVSGGTTVGANNLTEYTNQAMEFQAPLLDKGEKAAGCDTGAITAGGHQGCNHRSWHPVIEQTDRTPGERNIASNAQLFLSPWDSANIGNQEMYCSDCHGSTTAPGTVVPSGNNPWGPHGSNNNFILKGTWDSNTGVDNNGVCFRCHDFNHYATDVEVGCKCDEPCRSGYSDCSNDTGNLHAEHSKFTGQNLRCNWCHTAVPHGWKNKAFLVNLNDVGPEALGGSPAPTGTGNEIIIDGTGEFYNQGPYYNNAKLKIRRFKRSGEWTVADCGSTGGNQGTGRDWMRNVCDPP